MKVQVKTLLFCISVKDGKSLLKKWKFKLKLFGISVKTNSGPGLCNHSGPQLGPQPDV